MNCKQFAKHIAAYVDGSLDGDIASSAETHLGTCANCAALARELEDTSSLVRSLDREPAPTGFEERLKSRIAVPRLAAARQSICSRLVGLLVGEPGPLRRTALRPIVVVFFVFAILAGSALMLIRGTYLGSRDTDWEYIETCQQQHALFASANPLADGSAIILEERARDLEDDL